MYLIERICQCKVNANFNIIINLLLIIHDVIQKNYFNDLLYIFYYIILT